MKTKDRVTIELYVDDQGIIKIRSTRKELDELGAAGQRGFGAAAASADQFAGALAKQLGLYALVVGSIYKLGDAITSAFTSGLKAIDQFQQTTIGIAAGLTNVAEKGQGSFAEMFKQNLAFSRTMYEELRKEDAKRFSSLDDLMTAYNVLVQKGYAVRLDEVNALGVIADRIKLATTGQNTQIQINQELRSLMDGQARAGSLLASELKDRIGPGWEEVLNKHREAGTLLQFLAAQWPGITAAAEEIEKTLEAQTTTLEGNLKYVGREGLEGAYEFVVDQVRQLNDYLRVHGSQIAGEILSGWNNVKDAVKTVLDVMVAMITTAGKVASAVSKIVGAIANTNAAMDQIYGFGGTSNAAVTAEKAKAAGLVGYGTEGEGAVGNLATAKGQTIAKKMAAAATGGGGKGGGDKGLQASLDRMLSIIDGLERELARISEGGLAEINAWAKQQIGNIEKVGRKGADTAEALVLVERVKQAKIQKLNDDFDKWYATSMKDQFKGLAYEQEAYLKKFRGNKEQEQKIIQLYAGKRKEMEINTANELLGIYQDQYSKMAELTFIGLPAQIKFQKEIIDLEDQRAANSLRLLVLQGKLSQEQAEQLRDMQRLVTASRKMEIDMKGSGFLGGLKSGAKGMLEQGQQASYERGRALLGGAQRFVSDTISRGIIGALRGEKADLAEIGWSIGETAIQSMVELAVSQLFMVIAQGILGSSIPLVTAGATAALELEAGAAVAGATLIASASTAAAIMASANAIGFGFFHGGGIVAHRGVIVAHGGLNLGPDERLIKAQTGEWILNRRAAQRLSSQGVTFQDLNQGRAPGGAGRVTVPITVHVPGPDGRSKTYQYTQTVKIANKAIRTREIRTKR